MPRPSHSHLSSLVPRDPDFDIAWNEIEAVLSREFEDMRATPQDPRYHAEGDVLTHTMMVVESLVSDATWRGLPEDRREIMFWATILHDVGKPATTQHEEDGSITSRGHSRVGADIARRFLMEAGSPFWWREEVCGLIEHHQAPFWLMKRGNPEKKAISISYACNTADLCLHARHDIHGRICEDPENVLENIDIAEMQFADAECLGAPRTFRNDMSRIEYLARPDRYVDYVAHEDYRNYVILMCGLPGAGKDTWIAGNAPTWNQVCLDDLRQEMGIAPDDNQGPVVQAAKERAREHLRRREQFVWNATNVTRQKRSELLSLFRGYGAHTTIVYLEPDLETIRSQNRGRPDQVPDKAFGRMLSKLEPPRVDEAHSVAWVVDGGLHFRGALGVTPCLDEKSELMERLAGP
ncbi:AAA family ATPase [Salipiger mucosus]|uniref:HD domain-containing protein n=1 Tax=Salipiger mucosus DSM 16094 TaxID=1123237 RepID=S9SEQ6_9RHOB|nr:AAA family ATPase [Salipiger mucosus]EPX84764.1 hypothetical protein Salmuc_01337 [Salipiger mucosus DSM 16094]